MLSTGQDKLRGAIDEAINYLRTRHHPEKPHISVLSPPPQYILGRLWDDILRQRGVCTGSRVVVEGEEEEEDLSEIEELYLSRNPGHVFGVDFNKAVMTSSSSIEVAFDFYVRTSYDFDEKAQWRDGSYTKIVIKAIIELNKPPRFHVLFEPQAREKAKYPIEVKGSRQGCYFTALLVLPLNSREATIFINNYNTFIFNQLVSMGLPTSTNYLSEFIILHVGRGQQSRVNSSILLVPIGDYRDPPWEALAGEVYDRRSGNLCGYYYPAFSVIVGVCPIGNNEGNNVYVVKAYLVNLGGLLQPRGGCEQELRDYCEHRRLFTWNPVENTRWALGYLLEVRGEITPIDADLNVQWDARRGGIINVHAYNAMLIEDGNKYRLMDYAIEVEELPEIERSSVSVEDYFESLLSELSVDDGCKVRLKPILAALGRVLKNKYNIERLYKYQEDSIRAILMSQGLIRGANVKDKIVITARTAGGKTFAFLIPAVIIAAYRKLCRNEGAGVKAMLMYPTKALANDQVEEVSHLLYHLFNELKNMNNEDIRSFKITFGVLHGNVKHKDSWVSIIQERKFDLLPMHCPEHRTIVELKLNQQRQGKELIAECPGNNSCEFAKFLNEVMRITRDDIYSEPPDILITDEDMVNRILSGIPYKDVKGGVFWFEWTIFGAEYKRCGGCGFTYPSKWGGIKCRRCGSNKFDLIHPSAPSLIVLDEGHMLAGSFGAQVHHLLSLLEYVIKKLTNDKQKITYVLASATIGKPEEFAASLFGVKSDEVLVIKANTTPTTLVSQQSKSGIKRIFAFIMPKAYTRDTTAVRLLTKFIEEYWASNKAIPRGVVFTNFLDESNELLHSLRYNDVVQEIMNDKVNGHTTDFDQDRVNVENEFKAGNIYLLVATSTLEVGIDYGVIDYVMIYGMPNTLTSFIQRIGRAGRNKDAVVFVVFDPEDRIDYYFFENYKLLSNGTYREQALEREIYPVGASNEEAVRRAVQRFAAASLKLCCAIGCNNIQRYACKAITEGLAPRERQRLLDFAGYLSSLYENHNIVESLLRLKQNDQIIAKIIDEEFRRIRDAIGNNINVINDVEDLVQRAIVDKGGTDSLYNLRSSDTPVLLNFQKLPRPYSQRYRELRYVIKHALTGQVISYRGYFFAASQIQSEKAHYLRNYLNQELSEGGRA